MKRFFVCSFCEIKKNTKGVSGVPGVYICDTCIDRCYELIHEPEPADIEYNSWFKNGASDVQ